MLKGSVDWLFLADVGQVGEDLFRDFESDPLRWGIGGGFVVYNLDEVILKAELVGSEEFVKLYLNLN
jgi:hypothetical protein